MTIPTTRRTTADAPPRVGPVALALPHDPGLDALLADPRLGSTAKTIATALVKNWAWSKDHCWPSDRSIAARVGKSQGHVQRCLRELEQAGQIARERTAEVPNGRRIWLLWRGPGPRAGARPDPAPARSAPPAPARNEQVVVVNEGTEQEIQPASRLRLETAPVPTAAPDAVLSPAPDPQVGEQPLMTRGPREAAPGPAAMKGPPAPGGREGAGAEAGTPDRPTPRPVPGAPPARPTTSDLGSPGTPTALCTVLPRWLRGAPSASPAVSRPPAPAPAGAPRRRAPGLSLEELARVVDATGDPILAGELARRTAPPAPPEPPPESLATPALLAKLPGRYDLIAAAARRLCAELSDWKPATWTFCQKAAESVASRTTSWEVLRDCHRQATGPRARDQGRVFVAAWKRESGGVV